MTLYLSLLNVSSSLPDGTYSGMVFGIIIGGAIVPGILLFFTKPKVFSAFIITMALGSFMMAVYDSQDPIEVILNGALGTIINTGIYWLFYRSKLVVAKDGASQKS